MAIDLLGQAKRIFDGDAVRGLGVALDEQPDRVEQALALGGPAILAGLANALADPREGGRVADAIRDEPRDEPGLGPVGDLIRGGSLDAIVGRGQALLRTILGDRLGRVMDLIADDSGARPASVATLMGVLAPVLAGLIREAVASRGLGLDALRDLLAGQRDAIARQAPGGLAEVLGLNGLADLGAARPAPAATAGERPAVAVRPAATTGRSAPRVVTPAADPSASAARWALPAALGFLVLVGAYYLLPRDASRFDLPDDKAEAPAGNRPAIVADRDVPPAPATVEGRPVEETTSKAVSLALPGDVVIEAPEGSYIESMVQALRDGKVAESRTFVAGDLTFDADDRPTAEAARPIGLIAKVAAAYPDVKLKVNGRESLKDAKAVVSREQALRRAEAVREALVRAGVPADRVGVEVVAPNLPAEHPAAVAEDDVPISLSIVAE